MTDPADGIFLDQLSRPVELIRYDPATRRLQRTPAPDGFLKRRVDMRSPYPTTRPAGHQWP